MGRCSGDEGIGEDGADITRLHCAPRSDCVIFRLVGLLGIELGGVCAVMSCVNVSDVGLCSRSTVLSSAGLELGLGCEGLCGVPLY